MGDRCDSVQNGLTASRPREATPRLAVLMPVHAGTPAAYLGTALESVAAQSVDSAEICLYVGIDGRLSEEHERVIFEARLPHVVMSRGPQVGIVKTLNRLLDNLGGEEIVFRMDADDIAEPTRFERQLNAGAELGSPFLVGCNAVDIDSSGDFIGFRHYPAGHKAIVDSLSRVNPVLHPAYCMSRSLVDSGLRYSDRFELCEDLAFVVGAVLSGAKLSNVQEPLLRWRQDANFYRRRRSLRRGWSEARAYYWAGSQLGLTKRRSAQNGFSRLIFRTLPVPLASAIYRSRVRELVLQGSGHV